jgi:hypothetical protein
MKLIYNPTYEFNSADIFDNSEPPILYEAHSRQSPEWAALCREWLRDGAEDASRALEIVGRAIVSVSQNGEKFPLAGREGAEALREAIEANSPGYGDTFIKHLAIGHYNYHFNQLDDKLGNWPGPSLPSGDGESPGK